MALRDVMRALNEKDLVAPATESRLAGEGQMDPDRAVKNQVREEASNAPLMRLSQINEA
jgi:hypothetical protein